MQLASIFQHYLEAFQAKSASRLLPSHGNALNALLQCRTPQAGELRVRCPDCAQQIWKPRSWGHRRGPHCEQQETSQWLDRPFAKLLPVEYFRVTFT